MAGFENNVLVAKNINFNEAGSKPHLGIINAAGLFPIGTGLSQPSQEILAGTITSPLGTITIGYVSPNITLEIAGSGQAVEHITGDTGGQLNPTANNFNIVGGAALSAGTNASVTSGSGSTLTITSINTAKWIVDPTANRGTHTTIAGAIAAASSGQTIFIRPGTYTENLTLKAGVNLTAFGSDSSQNGTGKVIISGTCTLTTAGSVTISGIQLQTNSAALLAVTGSAASVVNLNNCYLNMTNTTGITFSSSDAGAKINIKNCSGDLGTTGIAVFSHSSSGDLQFMWSSILNSGASTTASTISAGTGGMGWSSLKNPVTMSSTAAFNLFYSQIDSSATNTLAFTVGGSGNSIAVGSYFASGSAAAITITQALNIASSSISSTNATAVITGAGAISYTNLAFVSSGKTITTTTQTVAGIAFGSTTTAPTAGMIGEQIRATRASGSASGLTTNTPLSLASVNLTAGIWDVTAIASFAGNAATSVQECICSISTTNNTLGGNSGDQQTVFDFVGGAIGFNPTAVVPAYRMTLTSTTTVYLVAQATFTLNTLSAYGRISGTRVG